MLSLEVLSVGHCPDCTGFLFRPGPRGGIGQNMECVGCGHRFNVCIWAGRFVDAQRIPNDQEWREDMFPKVLQ